jgi:hypothetical protein
MLPVFGNKVLGCHNCGIDIWGCNALSWTDISTSANSGSSSINLEVPANGW